MTKWVNERKIGISMRDNEWEGVCSEQVYEAGGGGGRGRESTSSD